MYYTKNLWSLPQNMECLFLAVMTVNEWETTLVRSGMIRLWFPLRIIIEEMKSLGCGLKTRIRCQWASSTFPKYSFWAFSTCLWHHWHGLWFVVVVGHSHYPSSLSNGKRWRFGVNALVLYLIESWGRWGLWIAVWWWWVSVGRGMDKNEGPSFFLFFSVLRMVACER